MIIFPLSPANRKKVGFQVGSAHLKTHMSVMASSC